MLISIAMYSKASVKFCFVTKLKHFEARVHNAIVKKNPLV